MNDVALKNEATGKYNFSVNNDELVLVWEGAKNT